MKNKIAMMMVVAFMLTATAFSNKKDGIVNRNVVAAFTERFDGAKEVSWSKSDLYVKASFTVNNQVMFAYFTETGEYLGQSRNLRSTELPIGLQADLKKMLSDAWMTELFEYTTDIETNYYVSIENADQTIYLKSDGSSWSVYKKSKKI